MTGKGRRLTVLPGEDSILYPPGWFAREARGTRLTLEHRRTGARKELLDFVGGYGSGNLGHGHPAVVSAFRAALSRLDHAVIFPSADAEALAQDLVRLSGFPRGHAYFTVGGSQAVEIAARIGRLLSGRPGVAVLDLGFHGYGGETIHMSRTFVPDEALAKLPERPDVISLPFNAPEALEILARHAGQVGTLIFEPIPGAAGFRLPAGDWLPMLLKLARALDLVVIDDEIQVGLGRTGRALAIENFLSRREQARILDMTLFSKSLAGGVYPISAVVLNRSRFKALPELNTLASLGESFSCSPTGAAAARVAVRLLSDPRLLAKVRTLGGKVLSRLESAVRDLGDPRVRVRGLGLAIALDLPEKARALAVVRECFARGLLIYVCGGKRYASVKLIPPLTVSQTELDAALDILESALRKCISNNHRSGR